MMMVPEAWQDNQYLSDSKKAFYEYNSCIMEPWDGPAMVRLVGQSGHVDPSVRPAEASHRPINHTYPSPPPKKKPPPTPQ